MTALTDRLDSFDYRLRSMQRELDELRALVAALEPTPEPGSAPPSQVHEVRRAPAPEPEPREPFDWSTLVGARALAWTGGVLMLLGIVFFFALAVERGWIGPWARVSLGAAASAICVGAGLWLRRRFGDTYASVSAAGVGVAGFYATLLAAAALYDLVPRHVALLAAAAIAGVGALLAIRWHSETLASLGLLGAMLVPLPIAIQDDHLSALGVGFAAVVFAAAIAVTIPRGWRALHAASTLVATAQALALAATHEPHATLVAAAVWLLSAGAATWLALRMRLTYLPASLLLLSAAFGGYASALLYGGTEQGLVLLAIAAAYTLPSLALYRRERDVASLLWAIALTVAAVGAASLLSGTTLTLVWAAEAAVLVWLARRIVEPRFQLASLAWLAAAYVHALAFDAPPTRLFVENGNAWKSAPSAAGLAAATAVVALSTFAWQPRPEGILARAVEGLLAAQPWIRRGATWLAGAAAVYAGSLVAVTLPSTWDWGQTAVAAVWAAVAVALACVPALRRPAAVVALAAAVLVGVYDSIFVEPPARGWSFASVAVALAVVALVSEWRIALVTLALSAGLSSAAAYVLVDGHERGFALLAIASAYGGVAVAIRGRARDLATAFGAVALVLAPVASRILLDATWLVLAWAATCAALALLARYEERLSAAAIAYLAFAFLRMLTVARPGDVFVAQAHPGSGVPAVLLVLAAAAVAAWRDPRARDALGWVCGGLGLYAATLAILELAEDLGGGIDTAFQRGHTGVSCLWGAVGLALLVAGLQRGGRNLRLGGLALFGISLAKLFLYDLAFLSSVTRALSFLAVGAVMVVGGFFYQRLNVDSHA